MENQQPVKKKQLTDNRSNNSGLSKRDNWKRSVDNGIATVNLENSTTTESVELQNISNIRNNLEIIMSTKIKSSNLVIPQWNT